MNTATLMPNIACVTSIGIASRRFQGDAITGWYGVSSPRCAASCCLHQTQICLPKVNPGSVRPQ